MMGASRLLFVASVVWFGAAACSSSATSGSPPDAGYCESNGYSTPTGNACPKGTCLAVGTELPCCGSECATCASKGFVSYTSGGTCPNGLCPSADVTASLQCCDTCAPISADAGASAADAAPKAD